MFFAGKLEKHGDSVLRTKFPSFECPTFPLFFGRKVTRIPLTESTPSGISQQMLIAVLIPDLRVSVRPCLSICRFCGFPFGIVAVRCLRLINLKFFPLVDSSFLIAVIHFFTSSASTRLSCFSASVMACFTVSISVCVEMGDEAFDGRMGVDSAISV